MERMEQGSPVEELEELEEELEKEVWRCLNSVHNALLQREILNRTLRKGWMELVGAKYDMGSARISHPLYSLKPHAGKAVIDVSLDCLGGDIDGVSEDTEVLSNKGPVVFNLIKDSSVREQKVGRDAKQVYSNFQKKPSSQLRRRPVSTVADDEKDELLQYMHVISDSDSEDDEKTLEVQKNNLQGFGALVSPQLRSAQTTFLKALELAVELLNSANQALDAHSMVSSLQARADSSVGR